jgi:hypothetical protein
MTEKITLNLVDDDGNVLKSAELEVQPMPDDLKFVPFPLPEPTPDMSRAEGFLLQHLWMDMYYAAKELHPDYRKNEHDQWQRFDPAKGWLSDSPSEMNALIAWLEATYPLKAHAIEHDLRTWMREHDFDI